MPTSNIICPCCRCYEDSCHCKDFVFRERIRELEAEQLTITTLKEILHRVREEKYELELEHEKLRDELEEEYKYNESGVVSGPTMKKRGRQIGADYLMGGSLSTNIQQVGSDKLIYYKLTMNMTNLETSTIDCTEEKEVRKKFKRQRVGL